jgi:serine/threonine-protein kinase
VAARFQREAEVISLLRSPHTIALYDYGITEDGTLYTVMELLDGFDVDTFVTRFGPVAPGRAVYWLLQVCDSLGDAHERGLIHRDIKPSNVFVGLRGRSADFVTVLDFGLVKPLHSQDGMAYQHHQITGTPAFMAPEQALGEAVDAWTDIYAVGCLAYFMLTGHTVFEGKTTLEVLAKHVRQPPSAPSAASEQEISPELDAVILACLEKDPTCRPQSSDDLARRLAKAVPDGGWSEADASTWWRTHHPLSKS